MAKNTVIWATPAVGRWAQNYGGLHISGSPSAVTAASSASAEWLVRAAGRTHADNDESVALGLARSGRVVTAAAILMAIPFAAQIGTSVLRMFGVGLTFAILMDTTLVRMVLLPAFMHLLGRWNWWAPHPLARLHGRFVATTQPAQPSSV